MIVGLWLNWTVLLSFLILYLQDKYEDICYIIEINFLFGVLNNIVALKRDMLQCFNWLYKFMKWKTVELKDCLFLLLQAELTCSTTMFSHEIFVRFTRLVFRPPLAIVLRIWIVRAF